MAKSLNFIKNEKTLKSEVMYWMNITRLITIELNRGVIRSTSHPDNIQIIYDSLIM